MPLDSLRHDQKLTNLLPICDYLNSTISENADPDVLSDMETHLNRIVPDVGQPGCPNIRHTEEGPDDMASHVKSSLTSTSLTIPISKGGLAFGTWQGIWLLEHRFHGGPRRLMITINGSS